VNALLHHPGAAVPDMRPVIVVVEENQASDIIPLAEDLVVIAQDFDAPGIALGTVPQ